MRNDIGMGRPNTSGDDEEFDVRVVRGSVDE